MHKDKAEPEHDRMFRYSISRFASLGPKSFAKAMKKVKNRTMKECQIDEKSYNEMFQDLIVQNNWDEIQAVAYFETSMMFE